MWTVLPSGRETLGVERGWMLGAKFGGGCETERVNTVTRRLAEKDRKGG